MVIKNQKVEAVEGFGVSGHVTWSIIVGWRDLVAQDWPRSTFIVKAELLPASVAWYIKARVLDRRQSDAIFVPLSLDCIA